MYGAHLKPPSYYELRVPLLQDVLKLTHEMLNTNKQEQTKYDCSIMFDVELIQKEGHWLIFLSILWQK